jgi:hypothetical protein
MTLDVNSDLVMTAGLGADFWPAARTVNEAA